MSERFPAITRAAVAIAYDNGGIHRSRTEQQMREEYASWLAHQPAEILPPIDAWLSSLSVADFETVCCGDYDEGQVILQSAPPFTDHLLNDYFDQVC